MSTSTSASSLHGRRVQIAGSASKHTDTQLVVYAHQLVSKITQGILVEGGGLVLNVGKEPRPPGAPANAPSQIFDWTALETAAACFRSGYCQWPKAAGPPIMIVTSDKAVSEIPADRLSLWRELLDGNFINVEYIQPGARSATMLRDREAQLGDILLLLGGGTGVEHSARLYMDRRKPVIPLDLPLGASREDGTGGAVRLSAEARNDVGRFFTLRPSHAAIAGALLAGLSTRMGAEDVNAVAGRVVELFNLLSPPTVFYTRLLNPAVSQFLRVQEFFREVVDPVVEEVGYRRLELGTDFTPEPFINVAIFNNLHFASVAVVDLTGERPNCFIELGYALGRGIIAQFS